MVWYKGLAAAAITGAGATLAAWLADKDHFGLTHPKHILIVASIGALIGVGAYLKQSPIGKSEKSGN